MCELGSWAGLPVVLLQVLLILHVVPSCVNATAEDVPIVVLSVSLGYMVDSFICVDATAAGVPIVILSVSL